MNIKHDADGEQYGSNQDCIDNIAEDHTFFLCDFPDLFCKNFVFLWYMNVEQALREMLGSFYVQLKRETEDKGGGLNKLPEIEGTA